MDGPGWMERASEDLRFGLRLLRRNPLFTAVAVLTLGLGIGSSTAIFSVVDGILLRPLPFESPERLVTAWADLSERGGPVREWMSYPNFHDFREAMEPLEAVAAYTDWGPTLTGGTEPEMLQGSFLTDGFLDRVLGIEPALGRSFTAEDNRPGAAPVVILSHGLWQRSFAGDEQVVGRTILLDDEPATVIGVLPRGFRQPFLPDTEIWAPLRWNETDYGGSRGSANLRVLARLEPGTPLEVARQRAATLAAELEDRHPEYNADAGLALFPLKDDMVSTAEASLWVLLGSVGATLLVVCVNLANLLLARGVGRQGELAVRAALGAPRRRIVGQLLTESLLLSVLGGVLGVLASLAGTRLLLTLAPPGTPRIAEVTLDQRVLVFAATVTVVCGLVFGLVPALRTAGRDLGDPLQAVGRGLGGRAGRLQSGLVVLQVALALILLVGAGLLGRSLLELQRVELGYEAEGAVSFLFRMPPARYPTIEAAANRLGEVQERLRALPEVESVVATSALPLASFDSDLNFLIEGRPIPPPEELPAVWFRRVTEGYHEAMGIDVVAGRGFDDQDQGRAPPVVIVNESLARRFFPSAAAAVGQRINVNPFNDPVWREIVGVARDVKNFGLRSDSRSAAYFPYDQLPSRTMFLVVRHRRGTDEAAAGLVPRVRREISTLDPAAALQVASLQSLVEDSLALDRFGALLVLAFAAIALQLAAVGLYGVVSYGVSRRVREIGLRMALGAAGGQVGRWVVGKSLRLVTLGVLLGILGAFGLTRFLDSLLFGVPPTDPWTLAATVAVMIAVAALASLAPAWRAARVDPVSALKAE